MSIKICCIAQFPPPIHGLSKAVETLFNSSLAYEFEFEKIDITDNKKILKNLVAIKLSKADLFYFTISQTKYGNLRDLIIFRAIGNRPCLIHLHGGYYRQLVEQLSGWQRRENYKAVGKLSGAIVLGSKLKRIFEGMLSNDKIFIVPNCVDDEYLMSDAEFQQKVASLPQRNIKHALYLSNFIGTKGYPAVLEMAKLEKARVEAGGVKRFHFDFAGKFFEKKEEDFFWRFVKDNQLETFITFHGIVGGDKKLELLKLCDIFILLTTYPYEGQPICILEASGNGMVIVTTDHAGIPDQVNDGVNGIVVNKDFINPEVVYNRLLELTNFEAIETMNRKETIRRFSQAAYINNMRVCFSKLYKETFDEA